MERQDNTVAVAVSITTQGKQKAPDAVDRHVAARMRRRRLELGVAAETVAKALRLSPTRLRRIEHGEERIEAGQVDRLCPLLEVTPSYFFTGFDPGTRSPHICRPEPEAGNGGAAFSVTAMGGMARPAAAEAGAIVISTLHHFAFLPLMLMEDQKLVEKHAREAGLGEIKVSYVEINTGIEGNDALIAGRVQFVAAAIAPFLLLWDQTRGYANVRAISALDTLPVYLVTRNPRVHSVADFSSSDRINVLKPKASLPALILQMAAAKTFGVKQYARLDRLTVGIPHPESSTLMISGTGGITADVSGPPFVYQELDDPNIHLVLTSLDVLDAPATATLLYTSEEFHDRNPRIVAAVVAAVDEAISIIRSNRDSAARAFLRIAGAHFAPQLPRLVDAALYFDRRPHATMKYAEFMHSVGDLKSLPRSWHDLFFPAEAATLTGD